MDKLTGWDFEAIFRQAQPQADDEDEYTAGPENPMILVVTQHVGRLIPNGLQEYHLSPRRWPCAMDVLRTAK